MWGNLMPQSSSRIHINRAVTDALTSCWAVQGSETVFDVEVHWNTITASSLTTVDYSSILIFIQLFGGNTHNTVALSSRGFISKNEKKIMQYLNNLEKYLNDHKVLEHIDC
jgi:hypothetical protein